MTRVESESGLMAKVDGSGPVQIDVWSDISCPWCYVGKVRLDKAIKNVEAATGSRAAVVKWHPYIIDRQTNPAGEEYLAYNQRRWGSDGWTSSLKRSGSKDGATFSNWKWWPNSVNGHRLVHLADTTVGKGGEAKHALFTLTYEEGKNVSDLNVLSSLAEQLDLPNAREYLASDEGKHDVLEEDKVAKSEMGIDAVPYFVFNRKFAVSGARDTEFLEATIHKLLNKEG